MARPYLLPAAFLLALTGCTVPPPASRINEAGVPVPAAWSASREGKAGVDTDWVARMGSPRLTALVREAVANNPDLKIAAARVAQARTLIKSAAAGGQPKLDLTVTTNSVSSGRLSRISISGTTPFR